MYPGPAFTRSGLPVNSDPHGPECAISPGSDSWVALVTGPAGIRGWLSRWRGGQPYVRAGRQAKLLRRVPGIDG